MTTNIQHFYNDESIIMSNFTEKFEKNINDSDSTEEDRPSVRMAPLGATASPEPDSNELKIFQSQQYSNNNNQFFIIQKLEEEQEQLNSSLLLLTSHFAQIQLRLKQIVDDKSSNVEGKLKELEEFAFKGVPDVLSIRNNSRENIKAENDKQIQIIEDLKQKLEELESYAYQTGDVKEPPTSKVLASQKFIIEQLRSQLDINLENFITLSDSDLKNAVDSAINEIINPVKVREKLVDQLKTQILDLERFIEYLQDDNWSHEREISQKADDSKSKPNNNIGYKSQRSKKSNDHTNYLIRKALNLLQLIAASQFGCHIHDKKRPVINSAFKSSDTKVSSMHWGDIRAQLEVVIERIIELTDRLKYQTKELNYSSSEDLAFLETEYDSDNDRCDSSETRKQLVYFVRKEFSERLMQLMQHGMYTKSYSSSLISISCFNNRKLPNEKVDYGQINHPWDVFVYFYETKKGREIVNSPICKLSDSFDLDNIGGRLVSNKQHLLRAISLVIDTHSAYRRSKDAHFKAFVCLALNEKRLVDWLRLILKNNIIINLFYEPWSYTVKMGFDDALHSLRRLSKINFDLPFDISIRQMSKIKDAF